MNRILLLTLFALPFFLLLDAQHVLAASDDDFFEQGHMNAAQGSRTRSYIGARDEQNLEVQASLPQPTRSPDGTNQMAVEDDDDAPPATAPSTD